MVAYALVKFLDVVELLILIRVILSWIPLGNNRFIDIINNLTEPVLSPIRMLIEKSMGGRQIMIDFSPIVAFLLINLLQRIIITSLPI
ncbi:MAG: YGGT family protein [Firmicutes bacterium ADurb.Bin193]|nr:MAG: YGGT family protein [Firmicutes bacterium ADurb.Bin193]